MCCFLLSFALKKEGFYGDLVKILAFLFNSFYSSYKEPLNQFIAILFIKLFSFSLLACLCFFLCMITIDYWLGNNFFVVICFLCFSYKIFVLFNCIPNVIMCFLGVESPLCPVLSVCVCVCFRESSRLEIFTVFLQVCVHNGSFADMSVCGIERSLEFAAACFDLHAHSSCTLQ